MQSEYNILVLTETWLSQDVGSAELFALNKYNIFRKDRRSTYMDRGGGVLLAVDSDIDAIQIIDVEFEEVINTIECIDILGVKLNLFRKTLNIFVIYVPPNTSLDKVNLMLDCIESLHCNLIVDDLLIIGDFNIPEFYSCNMGDRNITPKYNALMQFCNFFSLTQRNSVINSSNRLLDLMFCSSECVVNKCECPVVPPDSYHPPLDIELKYYISSPPKKTVSSTEALNYNFRKADLCVLYQEIANIDWSGLYSFTEIDAACEYFYNVLYGTFDNCVPKTRPFVNKYPPWINNEIKILIREKNICRRKLKKNGCLEAQMKFKELRARVKSDIKTSHSAFISNIESNIASNPDNFWSYINNKKKSYTIPSSMKLDDINYDNLQAIVDAFGIFFANNYTSSQPKNWAPTISHSNCLYIHNITDTETLMALKKLKPKMTTGPDKIPSFLLRDCASVLVSPIKFLFTLVIQTTMYPNAWKLSRVCPIFKSGDKNDIKNYRPITIISNLAKAFEILIHGFLYSHVSNLISPHQHGFMKDRSTATNLLCISQYISETLDFQGQVDVIYTDMTKAFDRLNHNILINKLDNAGVSPNLLELFKSYLSGRSQFVYYQGFTSKQFEVTSGVPQGSILGPLLFNIYINDITEKLDVNYLLYADDMKIYCSISTIDDCEKLQGNLDKVNEWCNENDLMLNIKKCNVVSFSRKINSVVFPYSLDGSRLLRPNTFTDLGVIFDPKLSFNEHIYTMVAKANKCIGFIIRNSREFRSMKVLMTLYYSFVRSRLEYCSIVWYPKYETQIQTIENTQRKYLKYVSFKTHGVYPGIGYPQELLLAEFNVDNLHMRRIMISVSTLYKLINSKIDCFQILSKLQLNVPRLNSRHRHTFALCIPRTRLLQNSPLFQMCKNYMSMQNRIDIFYTSESEIRNIILNR